MLPRLSDGSPMSPATRSVRYADREFVVNQNAKPANTSIIYKSRQRQMFSAIVGMLVPLAYRYVSFPKDGVSMYGQRVVLGTPAVRCHSTIIESCIPRSHLIIASYFHAK
ncbi:hypothetical protein CBL_10811 [Carabus blaptoides fortunei]